MPNGKHPISRPMKKLTPFGKARVKDLLIFWVLGSAIMTFGCAGAFLVAAGAGAGAFSYVQGNVIKTYKAEYYQAVGASSRVLEELKIPVTDKTSDALKTIMDGRRADGTPVTIQIERDRPQFTRIAVRTGVVGLTDRKASEQIHNYIGRRLKSDYSVQNSTGMTSTQDIAGDPSTFNDGHKKQPSASVPETAAFLNGQSSPLNQKPIYIYYATDAQSIPAEAKAILDQVTEYMLANPARRIRIRGYTDSSGDPEDNMMISQNRAYAIKYHLISKGIDAERISAIGFGARNFIASNKTPKLRALNRRVELELY